MEEQKLQRGVGQHDAEPGQTGGDPGQHGVATAALPDQDRRPRRQVQQTRFADTHLHQVGCRSGVGEHDDKGFLVALLALAQHGDSDRIAGVTGEMEATRGP
jgi:hypothetical protein